MNVLLLEDELELSAVASEQIENSGHKVFPAYDIAGARRILEDGSVKIDLLISDQLVPDGNGSDFAIESKASFNDLKAVVVSGQLSSADVGKLKSFQVDHYHKPVLYSDIVGEMEAKYFSGAS